MTALWENLFAGKTNQIITKIVKIEILQKHIYPRISSAHPYMVTGIINGHLPLAFIYVYSPPKNHSSLRPSNSALKEVYSKPYAIKSKDSLGRKHP